MKNFKKYVVVVLIASLFAAGCGLKGKESTYKYRMEKLTELEAKAFEPLKQEISTQKNIFIMAYNNLPTAEKERIVALENLNDQIYDYINLAEKKLETAKEAKELAEKREMQRALQKFVGVWKAVGMDLTITEDGTVEYKRIKKGITKSFSGGRVVKITPENIIVKVLVSKTAFIINEPPHEENGKWKMTLDGVELERVIPQ